jgi:uncharacterized protein (DUF3084 family)
MSTITALVHHIDQLLTQHRSLQHDYAQLQSKAGQLEQQLLQLQPNSDNLKQDKYLEPDPAHDQTIEDELNHLIGLFDQVTEVRHD